MADEGGAPEYRGQAIHFAAIIVELAKAASRDRLALMSESGFNRLTSAVKDAKAFLIQEGLDTPILRAVGQEVTRV